ncbi:MAG: hypothetical protein WCL57_04110 [Chloroflexota bacterium]
MRGVTIMKFGIGVGFVFALSAVHSVRPFLSQQSEAFKSYLPHLLNNRLMPLPSQWRMAFLSIYPADDRDSGGDVAEIYQMNGEGAGLEALTHLNSTILEFKWSPDGKKIAYSHHVATESGTQLAISVLDTISGVSKTIMSNREFSDQVMWSPKGDAVAFVHHPFGYHASDKSDEHIIMIHDLASGQTLSLTSTITLFRGNSPSSISFVPDYLRPGETMFSYVTYSSENSTQIGMIRDDDTLFQNGIEGSLPTWSPTYGKMAYVHTQCTSQSCDSVLGILTFLDPSAPISILIPSNLTLFPISILNGYEIRQLAWSPTGSDLLIEVYRHPDVMIYRIKTDGSETKPQYVASGQEPVWMPDSQGLFFAGFSAGNTANQIYAQRFISGSSPIQLTHFTNHLNIGLQVAP